MAAITKAQRIAALEQQVMNFSSQLAASQGQPGQLRLLTGVKVQPPPAFSGATDEDSVTNYILQLDNYFDLMQLTNDNLKSRYAEILLVEQARTWYTTQPFDLTTLIWTDLVDDLQTAFQPADFSQQARVHLSRTKMISADKADFMACFNVAYNRWIDISSEEA